jgi:UDP-N-acetylglucosamine:LPS N-acetylglucosamine transferase
MLRPAFYQPATADRGAARRALGLEPDRPTAVVLYGGQGSTQMLRIARLLPELQLVFLVGHNAALGERLKRLPATAPRAVVGYTPDVAALLRLGDFFIGKPGPGSISEALHLGLPVLTFENAWTMPQERYNARWVREQGVGLVVESLRALPAAVQRMLAELPQRRARVAALSNRAVYEVADRLAELLEDAQQPFAQTVPGWIDVG